MRCPGGVEKGKVEKMSCILEELRIYLDPAIVTICTVPYNIKGRPTRERDK